MSKVWYVAKEGKQLEGTYTAAEVAEIASKSRPGSVLVWKEGLPSWSKAEEVPEIASLIQRGEQVPPPPPGFQQPPPPRPRQFPAGSHIEQGKGLISGLFNLKFDTFITPKIISIVYTVALILILLFGAFWFISSVGGGLVALTHKRVAAGLGSLFLGILAPIIVLIYLAFLRMGFEVLLVVFRIREDVAKIARDKSKGE